MDFKVDYGGLLTSRQKKMMAIEYLKEYKNLDNFIAKFSGVVTNTYDLEWRIESG